MHCLPIYCSSLPLFRKPKYNTKKHQYPQSETKILGVGKWECGSAGVRECKMRKTISIEHYLFGAYDVLMMLQFSSKFVKHACKNKPTQHKSYSSYLKTLYYYKNDFHIWCSFSSASSCVFVKD
jgi:hypothetical protein